VYDQGVWSDMGLAAGPPGPPGPQGIQGPTGAQGAAGTPGQLQTPWLSNIAGATFNLTNVGLLGIGTTSPVTQLHIAKTVTGNIGPTITLENPGGGNGAGSSIDFYYGSPQARIQTLDDGSYSYHFTFQTRTPGAAGNTLAERMRIASNGNVGIGNNAPPVLLSFPNALGDKISFYYGSSTAIYGIGVQSGMLQVYCGGGRVGIGSGSSASFTEVLSVLPNLAGGAVGIGVTAPGAQLHVYGAGQTNSNLDPGVSNGCVIYAQDSGTAAGSGGAIVLGAAYSSPFASIKSFVTDGTSYSAGDLIFGMRTVNSTRNHTEVMRIRSNGYVSIGNTGNWPDPLTVTGIGTGGQIRAAYGNYGAMLRNDGTDFWIMLTSSGSPYGAFNTLRPLGIDLATGTVGIGGGPNTSYALTCNGQFLSTGTAVHQGYVSCGGLTPLGPLEVHCATDQNVLFLSASGAPTLSAINDANSAYVGMRYTAAWHQFENGNVGINTNTAPAAILHVRVADAQCFLMLSTANGTTLKAADNLGTTLVPMVFNASVYEILNGAVGIGMTPTVQFQLSGDAAMKLTTSTWQVGSDMRLKQNVRWLEGGLDVIRRMPAPIVGELNGLGGTQRGARIVSFDLEELAKVLPHAVGSHRAKLREDDQVATDILDYNIHEVLMHLILAVQQLSKQ
jgi:hypothetical protein